MKAKKTGKNKAGFAREELNSGRVHEYRRRPSLSAVDCRKIALECFRRRSVDPVARKDFWYWARLAREKVNDEG